MQSLRGRSGRTRDMMGELTAERRVLPGSVPGPNESIEELSGWEDKREHSKRGGAPDMGEKRVPSLPRLIKERLGHP